MKAESETGRRQGLQRPLPDGVLTHVLEAPHVPGAAQRRGLPVALTSEHYGRPALSTSGLSEKNLTDSRPPRLSFPQQPEGCDPLKTLAEPSWSQAGISPLGSLPPPKSGFNVYLLIRMPATRGPAGGPHVGRWGTGEGLVDRPLPSPPRARGGPAGQVGPRPHHHGCLTRMRVDFSVF